MPSDTLGATPNAASGAFHVRKAADIDRLIAHAVTLGLGHLAELFRYVRAGRINLVQIERHGIPSMKMLKRSPRPVLVLVGDDDYATTGPAGWSATAMLLRWATSAVVHGTGGDIATYRMAADIAAANGRFLLIETSSAHVSTWRAALQAAGVPHLSLVPPSGGCHPLPLDRNAVR